MNRPNPHHLSCLIGAGVLSLAAFAASAQTISTVALNTAAQAQVDGDATEAATAEMPPTAAEVELAAQRDADRNCMRYTGTNFVARNRPARDCVPRHGSVYTREDLDRTGEIDIGQALRKLDTSIR